jgi:hypothetical protein
MSAPSLEILNTEELIRLFSQTADRLGTMIINGEVGGSEITKIFSIEKILCSRGHLARMSLEPLLDSKNRFIQYYAAQALLALVPERSRQIIEENSKLHDAIAGDAGMLLDGLNDGSYVPT